MLHALVFIPCGPVVQMPGLERNPQQEHDIKDEIVLQ